MTCHILSGEDYLGEAWFDGGDDQPIDGADADQVFPIRRSPSWATSAKMLVSLPQDLSMRFTEPWVQATISPIGGSASSAPILLRRFPNPA